MARRGDGIYLRSKTWWLDFTDQGKRHYIRLGKIINRTAAGELAMAKRAAILKGEAGIGKKQKDLPFEKAAEEFVRWAEANKRPGRPRATGSAWSGSSGPRSSRGSASGRSTRS